MSYAVRLLCAPAAPAVRYTLAMPLMRCCHANPPPIHY